MSYPGSVVDVSLEMRRVINPDYWDGIVLGISPELDSSSPKADKASGDFALDALQSCLSLGYRAETADDQVYIPGSTFDPSDHEPGTVVVYHQEGLYQAEPDLDYIDPNIFRGRAFPKHPTRLQRELGDKALVSFRAELLEGGGLVYQEAIRYGVIPPAFERKHSRLITVHGSTVVPAGNQFYSQLNGRNPRRITIDRDRKMDFSKAKVERQPIPIGAARHFRRERPKEPDSPRIIRVTRLEVLSPISVVLYNAN
jgi:hypothetical protein